MADLPEKELSAILARCRKNGTPFILSIGRKIYVTAYPPDHRIVVYDPPLERSPDVLRALLTGWVER